MARVVERRRYRKVLTRMHGDEKYRELSKPQPNGQSLWQYLITGPHTTVLPGLFVAGEASLAEALSWPLKGFRRAWEEIASRGMAEADWHARVIWLPNAIVHNSPDNPNVVKGWRHAMDDIPECPLKLKAERVMIEFLQTISPTFAEPFQKHFTKPFRHGSPNQDQDQDQDQEQEQKPLVSSGNPSRKPGGDPARDPFTDPAITERAGRFIERYERLYQQHRHGARYKVNPGRDYQEAVKLCATWDDDAHLDTLASIFLKTDHEFAEKGSRTIPQFGALASWCDSRLAEHRAAKQAQG